MTKKTDIIIAGGGLAGLGLAHQLISKTPDADITVLEKYSFPRPKAISKVGESTVEIGSRYLSHTLGLQKHLETDQLKKFGIRMFFGDPAQDFSMQDELGASQAFGIPTYQVDRGSLENQLAQEVQARGVKIIDNASIDSLAINDKQHKVRINSAGDPLDIETQWLLDASGRASLVKKRMELTEKNSHKSNAIWFRIDRRIEVDSWTHDEAWQNRCEPRGQRWLSTNHLVGPGYWVWIIPIGSTVTSIGIVMDDTAFIDAAIDSRISAMRWLHKNQPRCAEAIEGASFLDFVVLKDYSYSCKRLFSADKWAITGEAGVFTDPFYSPGSDLIAIGNSFIADIVTAQIDGEDFRMKSALFENIFKSIYTNTLSLYAGLYGGFGDRKMMSVKLLWDYSYYWGVLSLLYFNDALADLKILQVVNPLLQRAQLLNMEMQKQFAARANMRLTLDNRGVFMDQYQIPCLHHFNKALMRADGANTLVQLKENLDFLEIIADAVKDMLSSGRESHGSDAQADLIGDYRRFVQA
ncbi:tryptophan 7-halogenase [Halioglobus sp.]|nr:tryptophan 7-halogenase [Halioglobus sp.]